MLKTNGFWALVSAALVAAVAMPAAAQRVVGAARPARADGRQALRQSNTSSN
jgi:hypothetical protein